MPVTKLARSWGGRIRNLAVLLSAMALAAGITAFSGQVSAQNLVTDGNFAGPAAPNNYTSNFALTPTSENISGWTVNIDAGGDNGCLVATTSTTTGCGNISGFANPASTVLPYLAIMTDAPSSCGNCASSIQQQVTFATAGSYTLSFVEAGSDPNSNGQTVTWAVSVGPLLASGPGTCSAGSCVTTVSIPNDSVSAWIPESYTFNVTSAGAQTLKFITGSTTGGPPIALLDTISITKNVPEPASLAVLGIGLAGLVGARRRRARLTVA